MVETYNLSDGVNLQGLNAVAALVGPSIDESYFRVDAAAQVIEGQDDGCTLLLAGAVSGRLAAASRELIQPLLCETTQ